MKRFVTIACAIVLWMPSAALAQQGGGGGAGGMGAGAGGAQAVDLDEDGYPAGEDCDDENDQIHPGAAESCNGSDDNCDGQIDEGLMQTMYADSDGDGWGDPDQSVQACELSSGFVDNDGDCDDQSMSAHPNSTEICDGIDNNCDDIIDEHCNHGYDDAGPTPSANVVSGLLLAAWLGISAWRRRRKQLP